MTTNLFIHIMDFSVQINQFEAFPGFFLNSQIPRLSPFLSLNFQIPGFYRILSLVATLLT